MATLTNPNGAFGAAVNDTNKYPRRVDTFLTSAAVSAGDVLVLSATMTATVGLTVHKTDVSVDTGAMVLGVAIEDAGAGETVQAVTFGYCLVNVGDSTIVMGQLAFEHGTTDGAALGAVGQDAETVQGDSFGVFLGANDLIGAADQAPLWFTKA